MPSNQMIRCVGSFRTGTTYLDVFDGDVLTGIEFAFIVNGTAGAA